MTKVMTDPTKIQLSTQVQENRGNVSVDDFRTIRGKYVIVLNDTYIYFVFALWYITEIIFNTSAKTIFGIDMQIINNSMSYVMFILLMVQILFFQKYDFKTLVRIFVITGFMMISVILSGNKYLFATWMFIVAAQNIDMDRVMRLARNILIVLILSVMILCYMGILEDVIMYRGSLIRHSLGFLHCNQLGLRVFQLVLCILYLNRNKIKMRHLLMIAFAAYFCYRVPNSQTATIVLMVLFVLMVIYSLLDLKFEHRKSLYSMMLIPGAVFVNAISVIFSIFDLSANRLFVLIDQALSIRFTSCHRIFIMYGVTLFGNTIYVTEMERKIVGITTRLWLDNAYMFMLLRYGAVTFILFSILYIAGMIYYKRLNENFIVIIMFLYAVYGIMETGMIMMQHNVFLLALGMPLYYKWFEVKNKKMM